MLFFNLGGTKMKTKMYNFNLILANLYKDRILKYEIDKKDIRDKLVSENKERIKKANNSINEF